MSVERVRKYFEQWGIEDRILEFDTSSATVELAAKAVGCEPARIAKTLSFHNEDGCILVVTAGDMKIDNAKFKAAFGMKARMLVPEETAGLTGYEVGGVCPFDVNHGAEVYTDISLKRFGTVYPACGSGNSAVELSCEELFHMGRSKAWVDVCKGLTGE